MCGFRSSCVQDEDTNQAWKSFSRQQLAAVVLQVLAAKLPIGLLGMMPIRSGPTLVPYEVCSCTAIILHTKQHAVWKYVFLLVLWKYNHIYMCVNSDKGLCVHYLLLSTRDMALYVVLEVRMYAVLACVCKSFLRVYPQG